MSVFIVGDIGINHNGDILNVFKLIAQAKWAGFDAVKFQKRNPERYGDWVYDSPLYGRVPYKEHKRRLEFTYGEYLNHIVPYCREKKIEWLASCFDKESVDFITQLRPKYWKIASPCITDLELVRYIAHQGGIIFISTGMSTLDEVRQAVGCVRAAMSAGSTFVIMHCCSEYPTPPEHVNLNMLWTYGVDFPCDAVGYSSHDGGVPCSVAAVALGAEVIEVHITLDRAMKGSDHAASLEREEMERLVRHIRAVEKALGSEEKQFYEGERKIRQKVSQRKEIDIEEMLLDRDIEMAELTAEGSDS